MWLNGHAAVVFVQRMDGTLPRSTRFGTRAPRWRRRLSLLLRGKGVIALLEGMTGLAVVTMIVVTYAALSRSGSSERSWATAVGSLLLVGNLMPWMAALVLIARRIAVRRAALSPIGRRGRLHVRLVALSSMLAALPTLLVAIVASLLFQLGTQFWFSDRARTVLANADRVAQTYVDEARSRLANENVAMAGDLLRALNNAPADDPRWDGYFASQVFYRSLDQAAMIHVGKDGSERLIWGASLDNRPLDQRLARTLVPTLADGLPHVRVLPGELESVMRFDQGTNAYLWIARRANPEVLKQAGRANAALGDYRAALSRSRALQVQFNLALFVVSLLILSVAIWAALSIADRLVRPLGELVGAARRVATGDLAARVGPSNSNDEVGTLAAAFNRMTRRLQEQTGALESRRALTEAVLSGVSAGVISLDAEARVTVINPSAVELLHISETDAVGRTLAEIAPELEAVRAAKHRNAVVQMAPAGEVRTLAVTVVRAGMGSVLTFDDITQQLSDQRRAAWADVARRIAHEIKNPLTPIQLAAERLQRRYGRHIEGDDGTFARLVSTIVRQVGDIRRMIDEFSGFARMPKPSFAEEPLAEIVRQSLFLQEVAHPGIAFRIEAPQPGPSMVCDRRQLGQAFTNLLKNAVEAIEGRGGTNGEIGVTIAPEEQRWIVTIADNGVGLPAERERLTEPYMTTRAKGTGLGLAIVEKIIEEHLGQMSFADRPGGGAIVRLSFDPAALAPLAGTTNEPQLAEAGGN
jgi:two-component system nitrogen regulation sensor histidine kinase NtrY